MLTDAERDERSVQLSQVDRTEQTHKYFVMQGKRTVCEILKLTFLLLCICLFVVNLNLFTLNLCIYPLHCSDIPKTLGHIIYHCNFKCIWILAQEVVGEFFHDNNNYSLVYLVRNCTFVYVCVWLCILVCTYKIYIVCTDTPIIYLN